MAEKSEKHLLGEQKLLSIPINDETMKRFLDAWEKLDNYVIQEKALSELFSTYSENTDVDTVLMKCVVLDAFYSTRINSTDFLPLAKHIASIKNIDERLKNGDLDLVTEIAECEGMNKHLSFASKFCSRHNPKAYPIYDKYVVKVLCALKNNEQLKSFKYNNEISNDSNIKLRYHKFKLALVELVAKFGLTLQLDPNDKEIIFKILDRFLWLLGKYCFGDEISVIDILIALSEILIRVIYKIYVIQQTKSGSIEVLTNGVKEKNTKNALRQIANSCGFKYSNSWNTQHLGKKLIEYLNNKLNNKQI